MSLVASRFSASADVDPDPAMSSYNMSMFIFPVLLDSISGHYSLPPARSVLLVSRRSNFEFALRASVWSSFLCFTLVFPPSYVTHVDGSGPLLRPL